MKVIFSFPGHSWAPVLSVGALWLSTPA